MGLGPREGKKKKGSVWEECFGRRTNLLRVEDKWGKRRRRGGGYVARDDDDYWVHDMKKLIKWGKSIC